MQEKSLCLLLCTAALVAGACFAVEELPYTGARPPQASAGECWCLVTIPAQFKTVTEQVMVSPASCTFETIPAVFETRLERVCVKPEQKVKVAIPAEYRTETYQHCVKKEQTIKEKCPAVFEDREVRVRVQKEKTVTHRIPAVYRTESYQACVEPARTEWRKVECNGSLPVSAEMREVAGECYCLFTIPARFETRSRQVLVEKEKCVKEVIPAVYETRIKRVCVKGETTRKIKIPAVFETRTREVCVKSPGHRTEIIPAEFRMVEKQVCVKPESKRRIEIPAKYETRTREVCAAPARQVWRRVDCPQPVSVGPAHFSPLPAAYCPTEKLERCCPEWASFTYENEPMFYTEPALEGH